MKKLIVVVGVALVAGMAQARKVERIVKPNSAKGYVAVVNAQTKVAESNFVAAAGIIRQRYRYVFKFLKDAKDAKDAVGVITIVDDAAKPPMTVSPEVLRAEINVGALTADLSSDAAKAKFLAPRARKEFLRSFAYMAGAGGSGFGGNILDVASIRDLDYMEEFIPADAETTAANHLKKRGLVPELRVPYELACEQGWAPAPTNEVQKKIWDMVHAQPTQPIKILPESQKK